MHYRPPATLRRFMRSSAFVRLVVGPVGSGKSSACCMEILRRAAEQAPGPDGIRRTRFVVVRNTYRELTDTTRKTFEQWIPQEWGSWNESEFSFRIQRGDVDCEVLFRSLNRPGDVKKLLSLELTGAYINEAREIPKEILDGLTSRVGRFPSKLQGGCTWFGVWADTNPWHGGHWGSKLFGKGLRNADGTICLEIEIPDVGACRFELYRQPSGRSAQAENLENLPAGYYARLCFGKDADWIRVYVDGEDGESGQGSVFGKWVNELQQRGGVCAFEHPTDGVYTSWDLGVSDATAIWFWRINGQRSVDLIDWHEARGENSEQWAALVNSKPYRYVKHYLPHDARARTFQTGVSTVEILGQHLGREKLAITPSLSLEDGIGAARWLLEQHMRIHERCGSAEDGGGLERLREYRFEWDEDRKVFSKTPLHDWTSHTADAFRYVAVAAKTVEIRTRPQPEPAPMKVAAALGSLGITLDDAYEYGRAPAGPRRIG